MANPVGHCKNQGYEMGYQIMKASKESDSQRRSTKSKSRTLQVRQHRLSSIYKNVIALLVLPSLVISAMLSIFWKDRDRHIWAKHEFEKTFPDISWLASNLNSTSPGSQIEHRSSMATTVPVLVYHGISAADDSYLTVHPKEFEEQMRFLHESGYRTLSLKEYEDFINGSLVVPDRSFLLTFDDGRKDSFYLADNSLRKYNFTAVAHLITANTQIKGSTYYLQRPEIERMINTGRWEFGSHSRAMHYLVPKFGEPRDTSTPTGGALAHLVRVNNELESIRDYSARVTADVDVSFHDLQGIGIQSPRSFAFPFGDYGQGSENQPVQTTPVLLDVVQSRFPIMFAQATGSFTQNPSFSRGGLSTRIRVDSSVRTSDLARILKSGSPKELPLLNVGRSGSDWIASSGSVDMVGESLDIVTDVGKRSTSAVLDGSIHWEDYTVTADVSRGQLDESFELRFRELSHNSWTACQIGNNKLRLIQNINSEIIVLGETPISSSNRVQLTALAKGSSASCAVADTTVSRLFEHGNSKGGIGFAIYKASGESATSTRIESLTANPL